MSTATGTISEQSEVRIAAVAPFHEPLLVASILAVTAGVYAATLGFPFVYDDQGQIVDNLLIQSWRYVPQYFKGQVWQYLFPNAPANYYRPLNLLWFRINHALFGFHPAGWHAAAILLHVLATYLAYQLARRLTGRPLVAAATALIFGVHPMRHGVVAWVSGTTESLWSVCFFAAFLAYLRSREAGRIRWMGASCALYALALLSKETAVVLPALVFCHCAIYGADGDSSLEPRGARPLGWRPLGQQLVSATRFAAIYIPAAIAYVVARTAALHGFSHPQIRISASALLFTIPSVAWFYAQQWLLPLHFSEFYGLQLQPVFNVAHVLLPALALAAIAVLLWWLSRKLGRREVAFAAAWMVLPLLPAFDLAVFPAGDLVHDRYFYVPGFGAALLIGLVLEKFATGRRLFGVPQNWLFAMLLLTVPLAYSAANAASYWIDDYVLFQRALQFAPANGIVRNNFAVELARRHRYPEALAMLNQLLQDQPDSWLANYNFARLSYEQGALPVAEQYFSRAIQIDPREPDGYMQRGLLELRTSRLPEAEGDMRRAVALKPFEPSYHFGLGVVLVQQGNCTGAASEFKTTLALKPQLTQAQQESELCRDKSAARAN